MPLVLASNDANATNQFQWRDVTGVQYHYPNGYRNLIRTGEQFVYYRGIRRADGSRSAAEYFGCGVVGDIWRDPDVPDAAPKRRWAWYCSIVDFIPFDPPVPAKVDGAFFEQIPQNLWRNGVRTLDAATFEQIVKAAGLPQSAQTQTPHPDPDLPAPDRSTLPLEVTDLLAPARARAPSDGGATGSSRHSRNALLIGNRAEAVALNWVESKFPNARQVRWVSQEGETPGWDIEVIGADGELTAVEVKGTSGAAFLNFELTEGELQASQRLGSRYLLLLVADCLGTTPRLQVVTNPGHLFENGELELKPIRYRVSRADLDTGLIDHLDHCPHGHTPADA